MRGVGRKRVFFCFGISKSHSSFIPIGSLLQVGVSSERNPAFPMAWTLYVWTERLLFMHSSLLPPKWPHTTMHSWCDVWKSFIDIFILDEVNTINWDFLELRDLKYRGVYTFSLSFKLFSNSLHCHAFLNYESFILFIDFKFTPKFKETLSFFAEELELILFHTSYLHALRSASD